MAEELLFTTIMTDWYIYVKLHSGSALLSRFVQCTSIIIEVWKFDNIIGWYKDQRVNILLLLSRKKQDKVLGILRDLMEVVWQEKLLEKLLFHSSVEERIFATTF